jgi:hypothetical protein
METNGDTNIMSDESKMCFMTVANRSYQKYVPWFLYFLNRAYPKAHKLVLLDEAIIDNVQQMLTLLSGNFEIRERAFPEYTKTDANTIKCLRWLMFEPAFEQYDCMSIGDVDMAVYLESPSYMDQHLSHCEQLGIPYSNFIRPATAGPRRLCGVHVVKPREWFTAIRPMIDKYRPMLKTGNIHLPKYGFNEQLLLRMIIESDFGEPPSNLSETYWPSLATSNHHGTHIRLAEYSGIKGLQKARGYKTHKLEIFAAIETSLFAQLSEMSPQIGNVLKTIARFYGTIN